VETYLLKLASGKETMSRTQTFMLFSKFKRETTFKDN
jgi:hypothetical protein